VALAHTAADGVDHGDHVLQRMRHHVAQEQIVAEAVADLRHFAGRRRRVKADGHAELFQRRPNRIEVARVPRQITQRLGPGKDTDEAQLADRALRFLHRFVGIVQRNHPHAFETLGIGLTKIVEPVVIGARDGRGQFWLHVVAHHDTQTDGRIERGDV